MKKRKSNSPNGRHTALKKRKYPLILIYSSIIFAIAIVMVLLQTKQKPQSAYYAVIKNCSVSNADLAVNSDEKKMLTALNAYRVQNGAKPLLVSASLTKAAQWLSNDMNSKQYMDHTDSLGRPIEQRLEECGYTNFMFGENIISKYPDPIEALKWWKGSSIHNQNLLDKEFTHVGIAKSGGYWTQDFGKFAPPVTPTVIPPTVPATTAPPTTVPVPSAQCLGTSCITSPTPTMEPVPVVTDEPITADTIVVPTSVPTDVITEPTDGLVATQVPVNTSPASPQTVGLLALLIGFLQILLQFLLNR